MPLLDLLRTTDLVSGPQLEAAASLAEQRGVGLAHALVQQGLDATELAGFLQEVLGVDRLPPEAVVVHPEGLSRVPLEVLQKGRALVVEDPARGARLAMSDPTDQGVHETVAELFGAPLAAVLVDDDTLSQALLSVADLDEATSARLTTGTGSGTSEGALFSAPLEAMATTIDVRTPSFELPSLHREGHTEGPGTATSSGSKSAPPDATVVEKNPFLRSDGTSHSDEGR